MKGSSSSNDVVEIRAAIDELRALGVEQPDELVRLGAAAMVRRCIAKYREREGQVGLGWLASAVRQGDAYPAVLPTAARAGRRESPSEMLLALEEAS